MRKALRLTSIGPILFLASLLVSTLSLGAQQRTDKSSISNFFNSVASTIYKTAWPTATYRTWQLEGIVPASNGIDVTLLLDGASGFDGSDLWLRLLIPIRNGELQEPQVIAHNAQIMPPFQTSKAMVTLAVQLAQQYDAQQQQQRQPPAPYAQNSTPSNSTHAGHVIIGSPTFDAASMQVEVQDILERWREAIVANNAAAETAFYATVLPTYYGRYQVSNADVYADKAAFLNRGYRITSLSLDNIGFDDLTTNSARVQLVKNVSWQSPSGAFVHKLIVSHLDFQRDDSGWKISGEKDDR